MIRITPFAIALAGIVAFATPLRASTWGRADPDGSVRLLEIADSAAPGAVAEQEGVAAAAGYVPVDASAPRPPDGPLARHVPAYAATTNADGAVTGLVLRWREVPVQVRLDRAALLAWATASPAWPDLSAAIRTNAALRAWWTDDLTYVRGSANARLAAALLGLDEAVIEDIALRCAAK